MNKINVSDIITAVGVFVLWALAIFVGAIIFMSAADILASIASTGIGAVVLLLIGYKIWKEYRNNKE